MSVTRQKATFLVSWSSIDFTADMPDKADREKFYSTSKYTTYLWIYRMVGLSPIKTTHWLRTIVPLFLLFSTVPHYWTYVYLRDVNGYEAVEVMEATHWGVFCLGIAIIAIQQIRFRSAFEELHKIVRSGVYDYGDDFSEEQLQARQDGNEFVLRISKLLWTCLYVGINSSLTKRTVFGRKDNPFENQIFIGWYPFEINSWFRYSMTLVYHTIMAYTAGSCAFFSIMGFFAVSSQFCAQLRVFQLGVQDAIKEQSEEAALKRLKKSVQHYNEIKKMYLLLETYFGNALGPIPIFMVFLICTFLYDITDPNVKVGGNVLVFAPEVCLIIIACYFGQEITNLAEEVGNEVYFTEWYTKSVPVKKHLLMIMIGMHKPMAIKGFGVFPFNMEGLNEVMKAGYSYFNALNAARDTE